MIQIKWWSRSSDDLDRVMIHIQWWCLMMIQIKWWYRSSDDVPWWSISRDDPDLVMMFHDHPDREMIQIWWLEDEDDLKTKMTWRLRRLEMHMTRWSSWYREEDQCYKLCQKNTFLVKHECWCICNFEMYSSMYLMYCNSMFIPICIYNVIESCCDALMFQSGESIMQTSHLKS